MNPLFASLGTTVFERMSALARQHDAINLGQGFPDEPAGPAVVRQAAATALLEHSNQYPPMAGLPELRQAIAAHDARFYGLEVDWARETLVTSGATEALAASILGLVSPGDRVVLFQPLYDSYLPMVRAAGGVPHLVTLAPPGFGLPADLDQAIPDDTRVVVMCDPLNPSGTVFSRQDLERLADRLSAIDAIAICDGVWEHVLFDGLKHHPLITIRGMRDRAVKIGSAGKSLSLTGWKVGLITASARLLHPIQKAHQFLTFTTPPNLQRAAAIGLMLDDSWFDGLAAEMQAGRDRLTAGLQDAGYAVNPSVATYFLTVDLRASGIALDDEAVCQRLVTEAGVAAVPISAFYAKDAPRHLLRFCFSKRAETLDEAIRRLARFRPALSQAA